MEKITDKLHKNDSSLSNSEDPLVIMDAVTMVHIIVALFGNGAQRVVIVYSQGDLKHHGFDAIISGDSLLGKGTGWGPKI